VKVSVVEQQHDEDKPPETTQESETKLRKLDDDGTLVRALLLKIKVTIRKHTADIFNKELLKQSSRVDETSIVRTSHVKCM